MTDKNSKTKYSVALGFFDGLHKAHMGVINNALNKAEDGASAAILLFDKHPQQVLTGRTIPFILQKEKRDEILSSLGVEEITVSFEEIKDMEPEEFADRILVNRLNASAVSCGFNYRFGKNGKGDVKILRKLCDERGIKLSVCDEISENGKIISSTEIRKAIEEGKIPEANSMLGRPFGFSATVIHGDHRGRLLGFPTINQLMPEGMAVPPFGVYASKVLLGSREYTGVTNIGSRPTFDGEGFRSETFILGYEGNLYGENIEIKLFDFVRPERKFLSAQDLKNQIRSDALTSEKILSEL